MSFIVYSSNDCKDGKSKKLYPNLDEAKARAIEIAKQFPGIDVCVGSVEKVMTVRVEESPC